MEIKLSILICTTSARSEKIKPLLNSLSIQVDGKEDLVEVLIDSHETDCVGTKRQRLLKQAKGRMISYCDSDDMISPNYVYNILQAIELSDPDCIGINGVITFNGANERKWYISKEYGSWYQEGNEYFRTPNHISPIRRELALQAGFPDWSFAEDFEFSNRVFPLLKKECLISEPMYIYNYRDDFLK